MGGFRLAASCIGWAAEEMDTALGLLQKHGFSGVEIAPTMVAGPMPYANLPAGRAFAQRARDEYGLAVCSLQSIWFGQSGGIFGPEAGALLEYTRKAALFAGAVGAKNLVFGCPKNRIRPEGAGDEAALAFFREAAGFCAEQGSVLALEANPPVYGTNFMNTTAEALKVVKQVGSPGCKLNLDVGTMVVNGEAAESLAGSVGLVHHVHISEEGLVPLEKRPLHGQLAALLRQEGYGGYISIEMKNAGLPALEAALAYVAEVFT